MKYIILTIEYIIISIILTIVCIVSYLLMFVWHFKITDEMKRCMNYLLTHYKSKIDYNK